MFSWINFPSMICVIFIEEAFKERSQANLLVIATLHQILILIGLKSLAKDSSKFFIFKEND